MYREHIYPQLLSDKISEIWEIFFKDACRDSPGSIIDSASCKTVEFTDSLFKQVPSLLGEGKLPAEGGLEHIEAREEHLEDGLDEVFETDDDDKSIGSVCTGLNSHLSELV